MINSGVVDIKHSSHNAIYCSRCRAKGKTLSFPLSEIVSRASLDLVHTDVWDRAHIISHHGYIYLNTFNDDYSSYTWVYFLILMLMSFAYLKNLFPSLKRNFP